MRPVLLVVSFAAIGLLVGLGASVRDLGRVWLNDERLVGPPPAVNDPRMPPASAASGPRPRAVTQEREFDFGAMERMSKMSHVFMIQNAGDAPLLLRQGDTSCKCTLSGLDTDKLAPGMSAKVTLRWQADTDLRNFRQTADIFTSDPENRVIQFVIRGAVFEMVSLEPDGVIIRQTVGDERRYEVRLASDRFADLTIVGHHLEDAATADKFEISYRPLRAEELAAPPLAELEPKSGAMVTVLVKPGLPLGPIRQTISLDTNIRERPIVTIPVRGAVESDISIAGQNWNAATAILSLGAVASSMGVKREIKLLVKGPHRQEVRFKLLRCVPDPLRVHLGEPVELAGGRILQVPLVVEIPPGSPHATHLGPGHGGYGAILLSTMHPDVPEVRLSVSFAVQD